MRPYLFLTLFLMLAIASLTAVPEVNGPSSGYRAETRDGPRSPREAAPAFQLELETRTVVGSPSYAGPEASRAAYVWASRALTRTELARLEARGVRYLGLAAAEVSVFQRMGEVWELPSDLPLVAGADVIATDRLTADLLEHLEMPNEGLLPWPVTVVFWPHATRAGVEGLLGRDMPSRMDLPTAADESIREASFAHTAVRSAARVWELATSPLVASIHLNHPKLETNLDSRQQIGGVTLAATPLGLDGTGVLVGEWDGGSVFLTHGDFGGRVTFQDTGAVSGHATHVAGTILGSGAGSAQARGFAPSATMISYNFNGNVMQERRDALHTFRHELDNHSWGSGSTAFGTYDSTAMEFDLDARDLMSLAVKSAGNEGQASQVVVAGFGFDSLSTDSSAKNILIIGATQDNRALTSFSSRGPTDDGRIKPDISANGNTLTSTESSGGYGTRSGTSMSAPSVTGMVTLLTQHYKALHGGRRLANDISRTLLIHTADDEFHPGPDFRFGWGIVNGVAAAALISADATGTGQRIVRGAVRNAQQVRYPLVVPAGTTNLKVTASWLDVANGSTAIKRLVHDLDLWLEAPSGAIHRPWSLDGANPNDFAIRTALNTVDNVEQVKVDTPVAGTWEIVMQGTSITDPDLPVQGFVICSDLPINRQAVRLQDASKTYPVAIPDNNIGGVTFNFLGPVGTVKSVRLLLNVTHTARGNLKVDLIHPDGTSRTLEMNDTNTRDDLWAVFPDLRSFDDDTTVFQSKPSGGTWQLVVRDLAASNTGEVRWAELEIDIDLPVNLPPVAIAPAQQSVVGGSVVTLDGRGSTDPEGGLLDYQWIQIGGAPVTLIFGVPGVATFTAPTSTLAQDLAFLLTVTDPGGLTSQATALVMVLPDQPPVASAGVDFSAENGQPVVLSGVSSFDPDGDPLTFLWQQLSGTGAITGAVAGSTLSFNTPFVAQPETLVFRLTVTDPLGLSSFVDVNVHLNGNRAPTAVAGNDQNADPGGLVILDARASTDPDGDVLSFLWTQISGKPVPLPNRTQALASFTAVLDTGPQVLEFELVVSDAFGVSASDRMQVTVSGPGPGDPVVTSVSAQGVRRGDDVVLQGSGLAQATVQIQGVFQQVLSRTETELRFRVSNATPVGSSQTLLVTGANTSFSLTLEVLEDAPSALGSVGGDGGGGGGGCQLAPTQGSSPIWLVMMLAAVGTVGSRRLTRKRQIAQ